jgi:hypothetical protein
VRAFELALVGVSTVAAAVAAIFAFRAVREERGARHEQFYALLIRQLERVGEAVVEVGAADSAVELSRARRRLELALWFAHVGGMPLTLYRLQEFHDWSSPRHGERTRAEMDKEADLALRRLMQLVATEVPIPAILHGKRGVSWEFAKARADSVEWLARVERRFEEQRAESGDKPD